MIEVWQNMFTTIIANRHAPIRSLRVRNKKSPWLTIELRKLIRDRDKLKSQKTRQSGTNLKRRGIGLITTLRRRRLIITNHK